MILINLLVLGLVVAGGWALYKWWGAYTHPTAVKTRALATMARRITLAYKRGDQAKAARLENAMEKLMEKDF